MMADNPTGCSFQGTVISGQERRYLFRFQGTTLHLIQCDQRILFHIVRRIVKSCPDKVRSIHRSKRVDDSMLHKSVLHVLGSPEQFRYYTSRTDLTERRYRLSLARKVIVSLN